MTISRASSPECSVGTSNSARRVAFNLEARSWPAEIGIPLHRSSAARTELNPREHRSPMSQHGWNSSTKVPGAVTLLDCTLRDGGYYNSWDFSASFARRYVKAMHQSGVEVLELGFRTLERDRFLGPAAYTTDRFLESLGIPETQTIAVMLNAKELTEEEPSSVIDRLFRSAVDSPVDLVRIAAHFTELESLDPAIERLRDLGYQVGVNLMQIASRSEDEILQFGDRASAWELSVAYIADSFGALQPNDVPRVIATLRSTYAGEIGCHMHDNMSLAFANTLSAVEAGASYADSTLLGMGRGPGNARTEYLATELTRRGLAEIDVVPLLPLATKEFTAMQREFGWGTNIYYFLSAANNVHPSYIQEMSTDGRYSTDEIIAALDQLGKQGGSGFSRDRMFEAANWAPFEEANGTWNATGWCAGLPMLIVGPGPSGAEHRADIEEFIRTEAPLVVALNAVPPIDPGLVDCYVICHPVRAVIDADSIKGIDRPIFMPRAVSDRLGALPDWTELRDYGLMVSDRGFAIEPNACAVPYLAAFPYALALAAVGRADRVLLTGFDGFEPGDHRQVEMEDVFARFAQCPESVPIVALTRTSYPISKSSIYAR